MPLGILSFGARMLGKKDMIQSLCGSLQADVTHTCETLAWQPLVSVDEGLRRLVT